MPVAVGVGVSPCFALRSGVGFSPADLFANAEQGAFYDPSDLTTLFQDAAGGTPVTADGDPVGLMLDKHAWGGKTLEQVLAGQPELVTNGGFDTDLTGWTVFGAATASVTDGAAKVEQPSGSGGLYQNFALPTGAIAKVTFRMRRSTGSPTSFTGLWAMGNTDYVTNRVVQQATTDWEDYTLFVVGAATFGRVYISPQVDGMWVEVSDVSIKLIPGNHASQSTLASRPTYKTDGTLHWLEFDGVDDWLACPVFDMSAGDEITHIVGVNSADVQSIITELSANSGTGSGRFGMFKIGTFRSRGTSQADAINSGTANLAVMTGWAKISENICRYRYNGGTQSSNTVSQGSGNYAGDQTLYIGSRGGTSLYLNGNLYGLIIRGALTADPLLSQTERWLASKSGVTL